MARKLLLLSNSTNYGESYLSWPRKFISEFAEITGVNEWLFVPYAGVNLTPESIEKSYDIYEKRVQEVFSGLGLKVESVHHHSNPIDLMTQAKGIAVGGGNTFYLVYMLHKTGLMEVIKKRVLEGAAYIGWSAGSNVACPTMKTTNDMPIIQPASFDCMHLIPFQINPHYLDVSPVGHAGETREQRLLEFLTVNRHMTVVGLREATLLEIHDQQIQLKGNRPMRVLRYAETPQEFNPGDDISFLLNE